MLSANPCAPVLPPFVDGPPGASYAGFMQVNLSPDLSARLQRWTEETGCSPDELIADAMAGYLDELSRTRKMLDTRYDGVRSGAVGLIEGEDALRNLKERTQARRRE